jgi:prepilin-type N-terminal cleavage/methylation domain-containing protein
MHLRLRPLGHPRRNLAIRGVTLIEALVTISVVGILTAIAAPNVTKIGSKPLPDTVNQVAGLFRSARSKAIAQTIPIKIKPAGRLAVPNGTSTGGNNYQLEAWKPDGTVLISQMICNSEIGWKLDSVITQQFSSSTQTNLTFPRFPQVSQGQEVTLQTTNIDSTVLPSPTSWELCFNGRGVASTTNVNTNIFQGNDMILTLQQTIGSATTTQRVEIFPAGGVQIYAN